MTFESSTVTAALLANSAVAAIIGTELYPDEPPDEAAFPCLTYAESNTPALGADNDEELVSIVFTMEAMVKKDAKPLAVAVAAVMKGLGYTRDYAQDAGMSGVIHQVSMKFSTLKEG